MQPHLNTKRQASTSRSRHPHFVPDKLDVNRLWRGVVTEPLDREVERVKGSSRDAATPPGLKRLIIDLYAGMKGRGVFAACPRPALSSSPIPDLVGMQQTNNPTTTHAPQAEDEDYDSSFLRDLVVRLLDAR